jgi:hypothetical protein
MSSWWVSPYNTNTKQCYYNLAAYTEIIFNTLSNGHSIQFYKGNEISTELEYSSREYNDFQRDKEEILRIIDCL